MNLRLKGKTALISGGSKGIGLAIKKALEKEGVKVISWSRSEGVDLMTEKFFIGEPNFKADILINNVGGMGNCDVRDSWECMKKNYAITLKMTEHFISNKNQWGRVITISSIYGKEKGHNPYFAAAKAAQIAYMKSLAGKYEGITFNTICPGFIDVNKSMPESEGHPIGTPEDVANLVLFLCSDLAQHINGATITVDGGDSHSF